MLVCDSLKEKIIIVAEHDEIAAEQIINSLEVNGFSAIRRVDSGERIYDILRTYHDRPEELGLILINEQLPACRLRELYQSLSGTQDATQIPFILIANDGKPRLLDETNQQALCYPLRAPINPLELLLAVNFLLRLKQERLQRYEQEERLINELAAKNVIDAKLKFLATHDELTGLFNRSNFERQLKLIINRSRKTHSQGALLFIDVDRFSLINELEGFEAGDKLLVELVLLIRKLIPGNSLFARIGADEFCLFIEHKTQEQAKVLAENIKQAVDHFRFFCGESSYGTSVSIGIASLSAPNLAAHPGEIILHGRQACHFAKANGWDKVWLYRPEDLAVQARQRDIYWIPLIRRALRENNLFLVFQPVVQLNSGKVSHYEVLLRMRGENQEIITPDRFIPAAERVGLIHAIDLWVVEKTIDFLASLPPQLSYISLAINLSGSAFQYPDLLQTISDKLELTWLDAGRLTFEITETAAVDNFEQTRQMINKIRALGCKFALDDFGAGFCSFNYLKTFPVDYVKIDGQFIKNLLHDETDQILVKSMVEIASKLGKKTIAEFIESPLIAQKLKEIGVNFGQGYAFGKPELKLLERPQVSPSLLLNPQSTTTFSID